MLIWLGVVGTVLALVGMLMLAALYFLVKALKAGDDKYAVFLNQEAAIASDLRQHSKTFLDALGGALANFEKGIGSQNDKFLAEWKPAAAAFAKSEQELADNLAALLREIKVSKQLAQGSLAMVEQNVLAVDKLWRMVEMIRTGPRSAAKIAPTDADAAATERGDDDEQQRAIEAVLANAAERMREIQGNFSE